MEKDSKKISMTKSVIWRNTFFLLKNWYSWDKKSMFQGFLRLPVQIILPLIIALIPKMMIDAIEQRVSVLQMTGMILTATIVVVLLSWIDPYLLGKCNAAAQNARMKYRIQALEKMMSTDYQNLESEQGKLGFTQSKLFLVSDTGTGCTVFNNIWIQFCINIFGIFSYIAVLSALHPILIIILLSTCVLEWAGLRASQKIWRKANLEKTSIFMKFDYFYDHCTDSRSGKDIRLYSMDRWFFYLITLLTKKLADLIASVTKQEARVSGMQAVTALVRETVTYAVLIYLVLKKEMTVSDFIFFFGVVTGFSSWMLGMRSNFRSLERVCIQCQYFREFLSMPEHNGTKEADTALSHPKGEVCFDHVSFRYQQGGEWILKDVNFCVSPGERIAIVGENGAGKTTSIKLLCGFYTPQCGKITIDGEDIRNIGQGQTAKWFSAVFQQQLFLPVSIAENVAMKEKAAICIPRLEESLKKAGIWERVSSLPKGIWTTMVKEVYEDASDFSGGEKQKLLLARALYKDAPLLILDEPTAALDPIAEHQLYLKYDALSKKKTSFYISHRLASTRFCDRILFFSNGTIAEEGTHEQLMEHRAGYYRMYQMQSRYYQKDWGQRV